MVALRPVVVALALALPATLAGGSLAAPAPSAPVAVAGLEAPASIVRDSLGIPHVSARSDHDAYFLVGWLHAQDRLFQMDQTRRQASGTLAELLGAGALPTDVQLRTLGLRRAAAKSLAVMSDGATADLEAYTAGVNAWLSTHPLPPEYAALELTSIPPWTALDSVATAKLLTFGLAFDTNDIGTTQRLVAYQTVLGPAAGSRLFTEDVMRIEPFAHAPSILPGETSGPVRTHGRPDWSTSFLEQETLAQARDAKRKLDEAGIGVAADTGSNVWLVSGSKSATGRPMVASDPHLALPSPSTFYELGIRARDLVLYGVTFPGLPSVVHGMNEHIAWGSTVNPTDVTDVYQESVVVSNGVPVATIFRGSAVPTQIFPQTYRANQPGNGVADDLVTIPPSASVPPVAVETRHGPLIAPNLSVQYTGFSATREPDYFRELARAEDVAGAKRALRWFDVGAQNWMFADDHGNIAYYTDHELPLREDLQAGAVDGLPPWFIRDGTGTLRHEWIPAGARPESHSIPFAILPETELDQLVNPERGWISNANQDPTGQTYDNDALNETRPGGGIRYVSPGHVDGNRNARVTARLQEALADDGTVSFAEMRAAQADVKLNDAEVLVPDIVAALQLARTPGASPALAALGADPKVQEAVARLAAWQFSTPTGILEGYDASDVDGVRAPPSQAEIDASVAATIYSLWRGQALAAVVDGPLTAAGLGGSLLPFPEKAMTALRRLLGSNGVGASGFVFFAGPDQGAQRVLGALKSALDLAASPGFAPAFGGSTNLADYRWGKLHRITFSHPLGPAFSLPPAGGLTDLGPGLPGVATDGGFAVVDASSHNPRAATLNGFRFSSGPARRFVAEARPSHPNAVQVTPGGASGNPAGPFFGNQLPLWLTDDYHAATVQVGEIERDAISREQFRPAR
jgi:penicillin G amidase